VLQNLKAMLRTNIPRNHCVIVINPTCLVGTQVVFLGIREVRKSVSEAAAHAEKQLEDAKKSAEKKIADSRKKAADMITKAHEDATTSSKSTIEEARSNAQKDADKVKKDGLKSIESIQASYEKNKDKAVQSVLDAVLNA